MSTYWLEGLDLAGLGGDVVDEDASIDLRAEVVVELATMKKLEEVVFRV